MMLKVAYIRKTEKSRWEVLRDRFIENTIKKAQKKQSAKKLDKNQSA